MLVVVCLFYSTILYCCIGETMFATIAQMGMYGVVAGAKSIPNKDLQFVLGGRRLFGGQNGFDQSHAGILDGGQFGILGLHEFLVLFL